MEYKFFGIVMSLQLHCGCFFVWRWLTVGRARSSCFLCRLFVCVCVFCDVRDFRFQLQSRKGCVYLDVRHGFAGHERSTDVIQQAVTTESNCAVASSTSSRTTRCSS